MRRIVPITIAAVLMLAVPSTLAGWTSYGDAEPSTHYDKDVSWMQPDPNLEHGQKLLYFNGWYANYIALVNPNVGAFETRNEAMGVESPSAILGVWVDCNGDGYIGLAEGALREYSSEVLLGDDSICPSAQGDIDTWSGDHNYNGWVTEFVPVANNVSSDTYNARMYLDREAMVWADNGKPGQASNTGGGGGSCPINPQPRGTFRSTGGLIDYAGCSTGVMGTSNVLWQDEHTREVGDETVTAPGIGDVAGLRFSEDENGREYARGHPVWDQETLGAECEGTGTGGECEAENPYSAVYVVDCDGEPTFHSGDTLNNTAPGLYDPAHPQAARELLFNTSVDALAPSTGSSPTIAGTLNQILEENAGNCDHSDNNEGRVYGPLESDQTVVVTAGKKSANYNFAWGQPTRGHRYNFSWDDDFGLPEVGEALGDDNLTIEPPIYAGRSGLDDFLGLGLPLVSGEWFATNLVGRTPGTVQHRADLENQTADPGPSNARWISHFAYVGAASADQGLILPGASAFYGTEQCGIETSGVHDGWDCDKTSWNLNADGTKKNVGYPLAEPGSPYNLRDIDCYDGSNNLGVPLNTPAYDPRTDCDITNDPEE